MCHSQAISISAAQIPLHISAVTSPKEQHLLLFMSRKGIAFRASASAACRKLLAKT